MKTYLDPLLNHHKKNGFTLFSLLLTIVIISILISAAIMSFQSLIVRSQCLATDAEITSHQPEAIVGRNPIFYGELKNENKDNISLMFYTTNIDKNNYWIDRIVLENNQKWKAKDVYIGELNESGEFEVGLFCLSNKKQKSLKDTSQLQKLPGYKVGKRMLVFRK